MFYNTRNNVIQPLPLNGYFEDGTLVQGLDLADQETQKLCGFLPVISDTPAQPENTVEDSAQRQITVNENSVSVVRVWVPAPSPPVPDTISARQIRLWLIDNNISLTNVETAIDTIVDEKLKEKTRVEWEYAPYIERTHPLIESLASHLGLTSEQVDQGFIAASVL
ncbi:hypothetical protein EBZ39_11450 [bacterium]|nr:hypothetical protein [bacterium]